MSIEAIYVSFIIENVDNRNKALSRIVDNIQLRFPEESFFETENHVNQSNEVLYGFKVDEDLDADSKREFFENMKHLFLDTESYYPHFTHAS